MLTHRAKVIDDASDSNHKKALGMDESVDVEPKAVAHLFTAAVLCDCYIQAREMVQETIHYYNEMTSIVPPEMKTKWEKEILVAESKQFEKPEAMDIIGAQDVHIWTGPVSAAPLTMNVEWLNLAVSMEERQIDIQDKVRRLEKEPCEEARSEIKQLRQVLTTEFLLLQALLDACGERATNLCLMELSDPTAFDNLDDNLVEIGPRPNAVARKQRKDISKDLDVLPPE